MSRIRLEAAIKNNKLKGKGNVGVDQCTPLVFGDGNKTCLATENLNSCHAIIIASNKAAILAHIGPSAPAHTKHLFKTGDDYAKHALSLIIACFKQHEAYFDKHAAGGIVVYGLYQGSPALASQTEMLIGNIRKYLKVPAETRAYETHQPDGGGGNAGTVLVEGFTNGQPPEIWIESAKIPWPLAGAKS